MKKITPINRNESSQNVSHLHHALDALGVDTVSTLEVQTHSAGPTTERAVRALQAKYEIQYDRTFVVDAPTADKINELLKQQGLLDDDGYLIVGMVSYQGWPVPGVHVQAYDQDLPSKQNPFQQLGSAVATNERGNYRIAYASDEFTAAEKRSADIVLVISDTNRNEIHRTDVLFNARQEEVIDIELPNRPVVNRVTEFENYLRQITPLLGDVSIARLTQEDVTFLHKESEIAHLHLLKLNIAHVWSEETKRDVAPELFYGLLRQGFPARIEDWMTKTSERCQETTKNAVDLGIISASKLGDLDRQIQMLMEFVISRASSSENINHQASTYEILGTILTDTKRRSDFLRKYREGSEDITLFWKSLQNDTDFRDLVSRIQFAFQLSKLTTNNLALMRAIQINPEVKDLSDLTRLDIADWNSLMEDNAVPVPAHISGKNDEERRLNYSKSLSAVLEKEFPTRAVAHRVVRQQKINQPLLNRIWPSLGENVDLRSLQIDNLAFDGWDEGEAGEAKQSLSALRKEVLSFPDFAPILIEQMKTGSTIHNPLRDEINTLLLRLQDFSMDQTSVDNYFKTLGPETWEGIEYEDAVKKQLRRMQRMYNVGGDTQMMFMLLEQGMYSANQIGSMPLKLYMMITSAEMGAANAWASHAKASQISDSVAMVYQSIYELGKHVIPPAIGNGKEGVEDIIKDMPSYEKLFGAFDLCECEHCKSVYSPAAYFVDLLHQVLGGRYSDSHPTLAQPIQELFTRRPDLQFIKLTCENTNTLIPYIDLVNEILETYVGFGVLSEPYTRDTSEFTAKELAANPQFIIKEAYDKLKNEYYPITLPFDLSLETGRLYLEHLGSSLYEVMKTFDTDSSIASQTALIIERLKLSVTEYEILTGKELDGSDSTLNLTAEVLFGYQNANVIQELAHVPELLARLEISYKDLISMLKTSYINPDFQVLRFLQDPDISQVDKDAFKQANAALAASAEQNTIVLVAPDESQCSLTETTIIHADQTPLTEDEFVKFHRFTRFWKKLGVSISDVDLLITTLSNGSGEFSAGMLNKTGQVMALNKQLNLSYEVLLTFWERMNALGEKSLYEKLFLNKAALKIDDGFVLNPQRTDLKITTQPIGDHIPALLAALRINETDLLTILSHLKSNPATAPLTLDSISAVYRYASLARADRMKVEDLIAILELLDFDIFSDPESSEKFVAIYKRVLDSGFDIAGLQYLYKHKSLSPAKTMDGEIMSLANTIADGLRKIAQESAEIQGANASDVGAKLGKIFDEDISRRAVETIDSTFWHTTSLASISFTTFPDTLADKFLFRVADQKLIAKGLMTLSEQAVLKGLSNDTAYIAAVDDLFAQPREFFKDTFYGFLDANDVAVLLDEQLTPDGKILDRSEDRYAYFLNKLLPFLRDRLYNEWVQQCIASHFQIDASVAGLLLGEILNATGVANDKLVDDILDLQTVGWDATYFDDVALTSLKLQRIDPLINFDWKLESPDIANIPADNFSVRWSGKLSVPATEEYIFYLRGDDGVRLWIGNQMVIDQWVDQPITVHEFSVKLKAGEMYDIKLEHYEKSMEAAISLQWSSPTLAKQVIPSQHILPPGVMNVFSNAFIRIQKSSLLINMFKLDDKELSYFSNNKQHFDDFDLNSIPLETPENYDPKLFRQWIRLYDYSALRRQWPDSDERSLISVFNSAFTNFSDLKSALLAASAWKENSLDALLGEDYGQGIWKAAADDFKNEMLLTKLQRCINLSRNIGIVEKKLNAWTAADMSQGMEEDIKNTVRAKYDEETWPDVSKTIHDVLRAKQRNALVSYLLGQPGFHQKNILTTNDLYQYFLIDVEMDACMMTSRIVQANASIQLFVQRCLMNLEEDVPPERINENHWKWMRKYRVWEANRKVFLYPENWIEPELRDDKSPFFKELENELLQGVIDNENVVKATNNYLQKLDEVARLDIRSVYHAGGEVHVVGRTFNTPHNYYYRKYKKTKVWTPWAKVQADIEGNYLTTVSWNNRLYLFWPIFTEKVKRDPQTLMSAGEPQKYFEVKLAWSEYQHGNWVPKQMSNGYVELDPTDNPYRLYTTILTNNTLEVYLADFNVNINDMLESWEDSLDINNYWWRDVGKFSFSGCNKPATATRIYTKQNEAKVTTFTDSYEEIYSGSNLGYVSEDGNVDVLLNNKMIASDVRTEENFPRFRPGKTFFLQDEYKSYWITSKPAQQQYAPGKGTLGVDNIELPVWVDDNPLNVWWEQPLQDVNPEISLAWDSPIVFNSFRTDISFSQRKQTQSIGNDEGSDALADKESVMFQLLQSDDIALTYSSVSAADKYLYSKSEKSLKFHHYYHHYVCSFVKSLNKDGVNGLFNINNQTFTDGKKKFKDLGPSAGYVDTPYPEEHVDFDLRGAYSQYNWELFLHLPVLIANRLHQDQRFEEAQRWYHFVFNPTSSSNESAPQRYWNLLPFKTTPLETLQQLMSKLNLPDGHPEKEDLIDQIEQWRDDPFKPHLIARLRPIAYMKNVVMKYLDNLIAWGDYLFRQDSLESINEATQLYVMAAELLGKKPKQVPPRGNITPETYASLRPKLNEFSNALVDLETYFPFYSTSPVTPSNGSPSAQLKTTVQTLYFCLPDNENLLQYWDVVADRLFKIRHCQNIEGVERQLSLFEPPIDPALLVKAIAGGLDIGSVLGDLNSPLPHYRFTHVLQKALEMTAELKSSGALLISALEKKDAEQLAAIRAQQETEILQLMTEAKKLQITEARITYDSLVQSREVAVHRYIHYLKLMGEESPQVPQSGASITEISLPSDKGGGDGDKKLLSYEKQDLAKSEEAVDDQGTASTWEILANVGYYVPEVQAEPWGVGMSFGGSHIGPALQAISAEYQRLATKSTSEAAKASKLGAFFRREQEWVLQANLAAKEIMQMDKQIMAAEIRVQIADKELLNHEQQISHAQKIEEFLKNKYTNEELYGWMQGQLSAVFFQSYRLAFDWAKEAEKAFRFENGLNASNYIQFGYWDNFRKGLLSGEKLHLALKRLEKAHLEQNKRDYEITKHLSVSMINSLALMTLKETGVCEFDIPELLFDLDFPGQYFRRIKSVSISIPCVVGPYTSVSAKLTLLKNRIRKNGNSQSPYAYTGIEDSNFIHDLTGTQSVATSQAQTDSGLFELNFKDERYLPFEGAGAISAWRLELPTEFRSFDYGTISDVILHMNYTAREGGDALKGMVNVHVQGTLNKWIDELSEDETGLLRLISMKQEFSSEWHSFFQPQTSDNGQTYIHQLAFEITTRHFPYFLRNKDLNLIDIRLALKLRNEADPNTAKGLPVALYQGKGQSAAAVDPSTSDGLQVGIANLPMVSFELTDSPKGWWQIQVNHNDVSVELTVNPSNNTTAPAPLDHEKIEDIYMIIKYRIQ